MLLYALQCAWFLGTQSLTYDEPVHIAEGLDAWRHGRFEQYNDHPPLARLWCTLPLLDSRFQVDVEPLADSFHIPHIAPDPEALAWRARAMNLLLGVILAMLVWWAANRLFSPGAANLALALFAFSPGLIAHFSVAATDGVATLFLFAVALALVRWRRNPGWSRTLLLGLLLGLMLLAKFSTLPMFVVALVWILLLRRDEIASHPSRWNWTRAAVALLLACFTLWAGYFFHVSRLTVGDGTLTATFPNWSQPIVKHIGGSQRYSLLIPAGEYVEGFRELVRHNRHGQAAFFLGKVSGQGGWRLYYPVAILLKWPTIPLVVASAGVVLAVGGKLRAPPDLWIMASFPAIYLVLAVFARFNIGERHVLPLYPFALLFAGATWEWASSKRAGLPLLALLVLLNAADVLRQAPGYLSYFNPFVRPSEAHRLLTDSNLDWGQGLLTLRDYERAHAGERVYLAYFGSIDPALYGIQAQPLREGQRVSGTVAIGATHLSGQFLADPQSYHWLLQHPRKEILDGSIYIFDVRNEDSRGQP